MTTQLAEGNVSQLLKQVGLSSIGMEILHYPPENNIYDKSNLSYELLLFYVLLPNMDSILWKIKVKK